MKTLPLGTVSINLVAPQHILTLCLALLRDVSPKSADSHKSKKIVEKVEKNQDLTANDISILNKTINTIFKDLNKHVPPFTYFGRHPTQQDHLGVWIDLDALHKAESKGTLTQTSNTSWKGIKSSYILDMSKEGLVLYRKKNKQEVWRME